MLGPLDKLLGKSRKTSHDALAVVTGAGSGIGAAFALELGRRGSAVVCSDIDEVAAQNTVAALTEAGARAISIGCDVSRIEDVTALAERSQAWFDGPPTLVINNAGVGAGGAGIGEIPLMIGYGPWASISGARSMAAMFSPHPAGGRTGGRPAGHHQRRLGRRIRRGSGHGRL